MPPTGIQVKYVLTEDKTRLIRHKIISTYFLSQRTCTYTLLPTSLPPLRCGHTQEYECVMCDLSPASLC